MKTLNSRIALFCLFQLAIPAAGPAVAFSADLFEEPKTSFDFYTTSSVQRSRRKEHPSILFKCWGRDTEWDSTTDIVKQEFHTPSGTRAQVVSGDGHDEIRDFAAQALNWTTEFSQDSVFRVRFSQEINLGDSENWSSECNSTQTNSDLVAVNNRFTAGLSVVIPNGVFVLRVKNVSSQSGPEIIANISHDHEFAEKIRSGGAFVRELRKKTGPPRSGDYEYYFVRPGDRLNFNIEYSSDAKSDQKFDLGYEVAFIGSHRCEQTVGDPTSLQIQGDGWLKGMKTELKTEADLHEFIAYTSCLRRTDYIREIMVNNHGKRVAEFIRQFSSKLFLGFGSSANRFMAVQNFVGYATLIDMTDLLLRDMSSYCSVEEVSVLAGDLPPAFKAKVRGFHAAARDYIKISYLLERASNPMVQPFIDEVAQQEAVGSTYRTAMQDASRFAFFRNFQYEMGRDFRVFGTIRDIVDGLPQSPSGEKQGGAITAQLDQMESQSQILSNDLKAELLKFAQRADQPVKAGDLPQRWNGFQEQGKRLMGLFREDLDWFKLIEDGGLSHSKFTQDLHYLANSVLYKLIQVLKGDPLMKESIEKSGTTPNPDGVDFASLEKLTEEVNQCIETPTN